MQQTRILMGMPITVRILDDAVTKQVFDKIYDYFEGIDDRFSTFKTTSEISHLNRGLPRLHWSAEMKAVINLCELTKVQTNGYFDILKDGKLDPSGLVKGWAINNAAELLQNIGFRRFYIDAGGDVAVRGQGPADRSWRVGIRNPFNREEVIKIIEVTKGGVATSGTYIRGQHIYNPHSPATELDEVASFSVVGPTVYDADRFATAAFAMGRKGIEFIEKLKGFHGYMVDPHGRATMTSEFEQMVTK